MRPQAVGHFRLGPGVLRQSGYCDRQVVSRRPFSCPKLPVLSGPPAFVSDETDKLRQSVCEDAADDSLGFAFDE